MEEVVVVVVVALVVLEASKLAHSLDVCSRQEQEGEDLKYVERAKKEKGEHQTPEREM